MGEVPEADGTGDRCVSVLGSAVSIDGDDQRVAGNRRAQMSGTRLGGGGGADETVRPLQAHAGHSSRGSLHVNGIWSSDLVGIAISADSLSGRNDPAIPKRSGHRRYHIQHGSFP